MTGLENLLYTAQLNGIPLDEAKKGPIIYYKKSIYWMPPIKKQENIHGDEAKTRTRRCTHEKTGSHYFGRADFRD